MNIDLKSDRQGIVRRVFAKRFAREETAEVIVPDAQPDILRILDTRGYVCLRGKDSEAGRVTVAATAELTVLYVPESGRGVRRLTASVPMELSAEGEEITADGLLTACLTLTGADARTVNPRKIVVRAEVSCEAEVYVPETVWSTSPREQEGVAYSTESSTLRMPVSVSEKAFVFTDEAGLPDSAPAIGELLRACGVLSLESVKAVGSRAVVKGSAETEVLYETKDGELHRETVSSPFSQIVETEAVGEAAEFIVMPELTNMYVSRGMSGDTGAETLALEIHAVVQCVSYADITVDCVTDAYSVKNPVKVNTVCTHTERLLGRDSVSDVFSVTVPTGEAAGEVMSVSLRSGPASVRTGNGGGECFVPLTVSAVYRDSSGELLSASKRGEYRRPMTEDPSRIEVRFGEPEARAFEGGIDLRIPVELSFVRCEDVELKRVESLELDEDTAIDKSDMPSVTLVRSGKASLWELAKAHMSTMELILDASALEPGAEIPEGTVLLIPRA